MARNAFAGKWPNGAIVSKVATSGRILRGKVVRWTRESDRQTFVMVRPEWPNQPGTQQPEKVWPEGWVLGEGQFAGECLSCQQPYRTNEQHSDFCPQCADIARGKAVESGTRSIGATLRGAKGYGVGTQRVAPMTEDERREVAAIKAKDQESSPF